MGENGDGIKPTLVARAQSLKQNRDEANAAAALATEAAAAGEASAAASVSASRKPALAQLRRRGRFPGAPSAEIAR